MDRIEEWRLANGELYLEVSSLGRVRRLSRPAKTVSQSKDGRLRGNLRKTMPEKIISPCIGANGYWTITYRTNGAKRRCLVHRLVALAFVPGWFPEATVDHLDGNRLNNHPENLEWVTRSENSKRQNRDGRGVPKGEKHPSAKISDAEVERMLSLRKNKGLSYSKLAKEFNVSTSLAAKIVTGLRRKAQQP